MSDLTLAFSPPVGLRLRLQRASPLLWLTSLVFLALFAVCAVLPLADARQLNGISVWIKPAKFFLSLAVHMLTLAWGISLLPHSAQQARRIWLPALGFVAAAVGEMAYILWRASMGEASHFNIGTPLASLLYSLMGAGAVGLMLATGWIGFRILREGPRDAVAQAAGWGFVLCMPATIFVGLTLGGMGSHWIGGDQTDATGLPLFGWSTTGGDLRPAHFLALHLAQLLPLAGWIGGWRATLAAAVLGLAGTGFLYAQALMGIPLIRL